MPRRSVKQNGAPEGTPLKFSGWLKTSHYTAISPILWKIKTRMP
ncbi:hypothetical protein [Sulfitobacter geojensis]|nr:hypothetical protein [Sulfitobacter geojensis]